MESTRSEEKPTPHDDMSHRYFSEAEYELEVQKVKDEILGEVHQLVESLGDGYLYESRETQEKQISEIQTDASRLKAKCDEYFDVLRYGI